MTVRTKHHPNVSSPTGLAHLANDLRLACMRISRRVRFESTDTVAPHQFSVMCRLEARPARRVSWPRSSGSRSRA